MNIRYPQVKPDKELWRSVLGAPPRSTWGEMVENTLREEYQRTFSISKIRSAELLAAEGKHTIDGFEDGLSKDELIDRAMELNRNRPLIPQHAQSIMPYLSIKDVPEEERTGRFLSEDEWKESEYYEPGLSFPKGVREDVARITKERKIRERKRLDVINRAPKGLIASGTMLASSFIVHMLDPLEVAAAFIPIVGQARFGLWVARHGKTLARLGRGAIEGLAGAGMLEPAVYKASKQEQSDYGMTESLLNVAFGTVFGGGLHMGMGAMGDVLKKARPWTREEALRSAVARFAEGREPHVEPILKADDRISGEYPRLSRWDVREQLRESFDVTTDEVDSAMALMDTRAAIWAEKTGGTADDYYGEWIAGIERGGQAADDALFMATKKIDENDPDWKAGKYHGDIKAAERYADKTWTKRKNTFVRKKMGDPENTLLISQVGSSQKNMYTAVLARKLAKDTGAKYADGDQYFIPVHEKQSKKIPIEDRIFHERIYEPRKNIKELKAKAAGKEIILIEDKITTGGSNRAFKQELRKHGIRVKDVISYAGYYREKIYESNIREIQRLFDKKSLKFKAENLRNKLTDGEAYGLIRKIQRTKDGQKELTRKIQGLFDRRPIEDVGSKSERGRHPKEHAEGKDIGNGTLHSGLQTGPGISGTLKKPTKKTSTEQLKLFQESEGAMMASIEFIEDGRALIRALEKPDIASMLHEIGHLFRKEIGITEPRLLKEIEGWTGVKEGNWTEANEEKFVDGFMGYLKEGKAPSEAIQSLFERFKKWLSDIYMHVKGTDADFRINNDVREFFNKALGGEAGTGQSRPGKVNMKAVAEEIQSKDKAGNDWLDTDPAMKGLKPDDLKPLRETDRAVEMQNEITDMAEDIDLLENLGMIDSDDLKELTRYDQVINKTEDYRKAARSFANCLT